MTILNGKLLKKPFPQVVQRLLERQQYIKALLAHPDNDLLMDIKEYWYFPYDPKHLFHSWLNIIANTFRENPELNFIDIKELIITNSVPY